jgi:iron-sulfur cluster assembly protein
MINISEQAAGKLKELLTTQEQPDLYLRLFITQGGCEGFSYGMGFDAERRDDDQMIERGGVRMLVDPASYQILNGAQVDYLKSQLGEGFTIRNPNAVSTCGCGHSFKTRHDAGKAEPCVEDTAPQTQQA